MKVQLHDMEPSRWTSYLSTYAIRARNAASPVKARFADTENALKSLLSLAGKVGGLEIEVPFWMAHMVGFSALADRYYKELGANITCSSPATALHQFEAIELYSRTC